MSFTSDLKKSANAYLYIFIAPDANLGKTIMAKRTKQMNDVIAISKIPFTPSLDELFTIIRQGIQEKYNRSPEQVLSILYYSNASVSGIGAAQSIHFDGTNWVDSTTGKVLSEGEQVLASKEAQDNESGAQKSTFWTDCASVITWIINLLKSLGLTKNSESAGTYVPEKTDWSNINGSSNANFGTYLPYVVVAGIIVTALMGTDNKKKSKQK